MSIFQCDECGCAENTACGWYWLRGSKDYVAPKYFGKALCSECGPTHFLDGSQTGLGKWHGKFKKTFYPMGSMETGPDGNLREKK